ncbi:MAG: hypothetical protein RLZZ164_995 [Actinomycetota bacterium]|jgi:uncharacterized Tic20 family protein
MNENPYASATGSMSPKDEKIAAILTQAVPIFALEVIGPIVGYIVLKDKGPFIKHHVTESLNFAITVLLLTIALCISIVGLILVWAVPFYIFVMRVIAAYQASQGQFYRYPLILRLIK